LTRFSGGDDGDGEGELVPGVDGVARDALRAELEYSLNSRKFGRLF